MEITPEMLVEEMEGHNETLLEFKKHIEMHIARQEDTNDLKEKAKKYAHVKFDLKTMLFFIDTGKNVFTPYLGGDQFGNFHFMTPVNNYLGGVASPSAAKMNTYIWEEEEENLSRQHHLLPLLGVSPPRSDWRIRHSPRTSSFRCGEL